MLRARVRPSLPVRHWTRRISSRLFHFSTTQSQQTRHKQQGCKASIACRTAEVRHARPGDDTWEDATSERGIDGLGSAPKNAAAQHEWLCTRSSARRSAHPRVRHRPGPLALAISQERRGSRPQPFPVCAAPYRILHRSEAVSRVCFFHADFCPASSRRAITPKGPPPGPPPAAMPQSPYPQQPQANYSAPSPYQQPAPAYGNGTASYASPVPPSHSAATQSPAAWPQPAPAWTPSPQQPAHPAVQPPAPISFAAPPNHHHAAATATSAAPPAAAPSAAPVSVAKGFNPGATVVRRPAPPAAIGTFKPPPAAPAAPPAPVAPPHVAPPAAVAPRLAARPAPIATPPANYVPPTAPTMPAPSAAAPTLEDISDSDSFSNGQPASAQPYAATSHQLPPQPSYAVPPQPSYAAQQPYAANGHQPPPQPSYAVPPMAQPAAPPPSYAPPAAASAPVLPGDPRTLGFGTDQGRWLSQSIQRGPSDGANPFRQQRQY